MRQNCPSDLRVGVDVRISSLFETRQHAVGGMMTEIQQSHELHLILITTSWLLLEQFLVMRFINLQRNYGKYRFV